MKKLAKVLSLALVLVMVLSLGGTAWADVTVTAATINDQGGGEHLHTFKAFQLFTGTQTADESNKELENIEWGSALSTDDLKNSFISAVNSVYGSETGLVTVNTSTTPETGSTAAEVADVISTFDTAQAEEFAKELDVFLKDLGGTDLSGVTTLPTGYYLIVDKTTIEEGDARNASLLQLTQDITVAVKTDIPSQVKKVQDNEDEVTSQDHVEFNSDVNGPQITAGEGYNDVADYHIGDTVPFEILSRIPDMHYYEEYFFQFHDKMDDGLTLNPQSFTITIGDYTLDEDEIRDVYSNGSELTTPCTFHITFRDLKDFVGDHLAAINPSKNAEYQRLNEEQNLNPGNEGYKALTLDDMVGLPIRITFKAVLNEDAEIGNETGNVNTSQLEFSNNPDSDGRGKTVEDKVIVFTYKLENEKYSGRTTVLSDSAKYYSSAANMLSDTASSNTQGSNTYATDNGKNYVLIDGKWHELLSDVKFVLANEEGKIAIFHNTDDGQKIVGWTNQYTADAIKTELEKDTPTKTFDAMNVAEFRENFNATDHTKWEINELLDISSPETVTLLMTSDAAGYFEAIGIDEGNYTLHEVVAPVGYNPITGGKEFTITATEIDDRQDWSDGYSTSAITKLELTIDRETTTQDVTNGIVKFGVENNQGTSLPETGGVGTTLFYVFGSMLVIAAAVYFVTKKRSEVE